MISFPNTVADAVLAPGYASQQYVDDYLKPHMKRFETTVGVLKTICVPGLRIIDLASYGSLVPALSRILGLTDIVVTTPKTVNSPASEDTCLADARNGHLFRYHVDRFDIEEPFPYGDESFDVVLFTEVLEHLSVDPMYTLGEINRITKTGGWLMLSTPNCASTKSVLKILRGGNPCLYPVYTRQPSRDRHNREYVPWEVRRLMVASGFEPTRLDVIDVYKEAMPFLWVIHAGLWIGSLISFGIIKARQRGDTIFALGKKVSPVIDRYPDFLYA